MPDTIQGSATVVNVISTDIIECTTAELSRDVDALQFEFGGIFTDISELSAGLYTVVLTLTVSHSVYGEFTMKPTNTNAFTVAYADVPGLALITSNWSGRYIGTPVNITVTSRTYNVITGAQLLYEIKYENIVLYSFTANLSNGSTQSSHTISAEQFAELTMGVYSITVTSIRAGVHKEVRAIAYEAVKPPTLHFVKVDPDIINLPLEQPEDVSISFYVDGRGIDSVQGVFELMGTPYVVTLNQNI